MQKWTITYQNLWSLIWYWKQSTIWSSGSFLGDHKKFPFYRVVMWDIESKKFLRELLLRFARIGLWVSVVIKDCLFFFWSCVCVLFLIPMYTFCDAFYMKCIHILICFLMLLVRPWSNGKIDLLWYTGCGIPTLQPFGFELFDRYMNALCTVQPFFYSIFFLA